MPYAAVKVIRPLVRVSSHLSPRITGKLAFRLFCTPVGRAPVRTDNPRIREAQAVFSKAELSNLTYGCGYVRTARFEPDRTRRGTVLLLHGWGGQGLFMAGFVEPLLAHGYRVVAIDLPGHGGSSGRHLTFPLAIEALSAVSRGELPLAGIVGHSFGGAVAVAAAAGGVPAFAALPVRKIVTVAAPNAMQPYGKAFADMLGLTARGHAAFEGEVQNVAGRPMESFASDAYLADLKVPTLLIHAPDDREIPYADAQAMLAAGPHVSLRPAPGLGHRRILFDSGVQQAAAEFIAA
ncbi:MAG TPA: alpha/beta fold hydrolase [Rhabdaerophilum sp.]|nr:alpha/beta fold hydrolase [Rhabdaerophilum sp.]